MTGGPARAAVVVPAFGDPAGLRRTLDALAAQDVGVPPQIIVAVDGPDPRLHRIARTAGADVVVLDVNRGSYAARNAGLDLVDPDVAVVCFTDADAVPEPGWITAHMRALEGAEASGGRVRGLFSTPPTAAEVVDSARHLQQSYYVERLGFAATVNLAVRREVVDRLRFDGGLRSGGDREWCNRLRAAGMSLVYTDDAVVGHPLRGSATALLRKVHRIAGGTAAIDRGATEVAQSDLDTRQGAAALASEMELPPLVRSRVRALDLAADLVWAVRVPGKIPGALRRRARRRRRARPPHVLIVVENLPVPLDRRVWYEATALREAGYEVTVICPAIRGYEAGTRVIDGVRVRYHRMPAEGRGVKGFIREYSAALAWELREALRAGRVDVVHICNPPDLLWLIALPLKLVWGARIVYDQHDLWPGMYEAKYGRRDALFWAVRLMERCSYAVADRTIATNQTGVEVATGRGGQDPGSVVVVGSGPDPAEFVPQQVDPAVRRGRAELLAYVGVIGDQDGVEHLIDAHSELVRRGRDVHLMVIGDGPAVPDLRARAQAAVGSDRVEFTGVLRGAELRRHLASADVCVDPEPVNGYSEFCTTNKVLEYMALARPIAMFDRVEGRRSAGDAARYARPNDPLSLADAVEGLLEDDESRAELGARGRRRIEDHLGWPNQRRALLALYEDLLHPTST